MGIQFHKRKRTSNGNNLNVSASSNGLTGSVSKSFMWGTVGTKGFTIKSPISGLFIRCSNKNPMYVVMVIVAIISTVITYPFECLNRA